MRLELNSLPLKYDEPLSNFAFNFNLRRYSMDDYTTKPVKLALLLDVISKVRRCRVILARPH
jgi:hypothetical protein